MQNPHELVGERAQGHVMGVALGPATVVVPTRAG